VFQFREGIIPAAGYFGPKTRARVNKLLGTQIQASNQQAVTETGQSAAQAITSQAANNSISNMQSQLETLLKQIALLQQQVKTQEQNQANINTSISTSNTSSQNSTSTADILEITSVNIVPGETSAKIEWQTNKPTESKIFISGGNLSSKIFTSVSGLSTRHSAMVSGLLEETTYSYEIEAIAGGITVVKKQGAFKTNPPPPAPQFLSGPTPVIEIDHEGYSYISRIDWITDKPSIVVESPILGNSDPYNWRNSWERMKQDCFPLPVESFQRNITYTCKFIIQDSATQVKVQKDFSFTAY